MSLILDIVKFNPEDHYDLLSSWWKERDRPIPELRFLPPTGYLIQYKKDSICAGFLFKTDAGIAIISHIISSPRKFDKDLRNNAIELLLAVLIDKAKSDGFNLVTAASNVDKLNNRYEKLGFEKSDSNETHFGRTF